MTLDRAAIDAMRDTLRSGGVRAVVVSDEAKKRLQVFPTPPELAAHMIELAELDPATHYSLEPSAGFGALASLMGRTDVCELYPTARDYLTEHGYNLVGRDFLDYHPGPVYDRIIANPPWNGGRDVEHVRHMWECLTPGGRLVAVVSPGVGFRQDRRHRDFRAWALAELRGDYEEIDPGTFEASGTQVGALLLTIDKPF